MKNRWMMRAKSEQMSVFFFVETAQMSVVAYAHITMETDFPWKKSDRFPVSTLAREKDNSMLASKRCQILTLF